MGQVVDLRSERAFRSELVAMASPPERDQFFLGANVLQSHGPVNVWVGVMKMPKRARVGVSLAEQFVSLVSQEYEYVISVTRTEGMSFRQNSYVAECPSGVAEFVRLAKLDLNEMERFTFTNYTGEPDELFLTV